MYSSLSLVSMLFIASWSAVRTTERGKLPWKPAGRMVKPLLRPGRCAGQPANLPTCLPACLPIATGRTLKRAPRRHMQRSLSAISTRRLTNVTPALDDHSSSLATSSWLTPAPWPLGKSGRQGSQCGELQVAGGPHWEKAGRSKQHRRRRRAAQAGARGHSPSGQRAQR